MRDSVIFYKSFLEAIEDLSPKAFKDCVLAILKYGFNNEEPTNNGIAKTVFLMAKPQIDKNNQRFENGKKGGRPKTEIKPKGNQTKTKTKKSKPNVNDNVNDNVNVNDNDNVNVNVIPPDVGVRAEGNFNEKFNVFCTKWGISIDTNSPLIADLDFDKLGEAYLESKTLLQNKEKAPYAHTLSWIVKNASSIYAGKYRDKEDSRNISGNNPVLPGELVL